MEYTTNAPVGAAYLDEAQPGWAERIDLGKLDMTSSTRCIGGQLNGSFVRFVANATGHPGAIRMDGELIAWAIDRGFDSPEENWGDSQRALAAEWAELVRERLG